SANEHRPAVTNLGGCAAYCCPAGITLIIQPTPKRSVTMPNRGDQKVLVSGIRTCPPSFSAAKARSASASLGTEREREKPSKLGFSAEQPSDAITEVWPIRKRVCMILSSKQAGTIRGWLGSGLA